MLWTPQQQFHDWPFDKEADLEVTIARVKTTLFGESRMYFEVAIPSIYLAPPSPCSHVWHKAIYSCVVDRYCSCRSTFVIVLYKRPSSLKKSVSSQLIANR